MERTTIGRIRQCAGGVLKYAELRDVRVSKLLCEGVTPLVAGPFEVDSNLSVKAKQAPGLVDSYALYDIRATSNTGEQAWMVRLEMVGSWETSEDAPEWDEEHLTCFAIAIGALTLHPYARENVQSAVSRLGYPPFTLDMLTSPVAGDDDDIIDIDPVDPLEVDSPSGAHGDS